MITVYNEEHPDEKPSYQLEPEDTIVMYHYDKAMKVQQAELTESLCTGFTFQPIKKD